VNVISIGEVLWDVVGANEHLGGAPFNFAAHLKRLGHEVWFVSAVGDDPRGARIVERMAAMGLASRYVRRNAQYATGSVTVTLKAAGQPEFVIHRPAAYDFPELSPAMLRELSSQSVNWIYFGTLLQMSSPARELTSRILGALPKARRFYDVNLRVGCWTPALVRELMEQATVVKLNEDEVEEIARAFDTKHDSLEQFCRSYARQFRWEGVCVTRGVAGCALLLGNEYVEAEGYRVTVADAVGAGDAFAAAFLHGLGSGWPPVRIADFANRVGALVASRSGAIPDWNFEEVAQLQH
jgi:fructokinase